MNELRRYFCFAFYFTGSNFDWILFGYKKQIKRFFKIEVNEEKTALSEYLVASSEMGAVPIAFSLLATFVSTTTFLGN